MGEINRKKGRIGNIKAVILYSGWESNKPLLPFYLFLSDFLLNKFIQILLGLEYMHNLKHVLTIFCVINMLQNMVFSGCSYLWWLYHLFSLFMGPISVPWRFTSTLCLYWVPLSSVWCSLVWPPATYGSLHINSIVLPETIGSWSNHVNFDSQWDVNRAFTYSLEICSRMLFPL